METRYRSRRAEIADLRAQMQAANATLAGIADRIRERFRVNSRVAFRLARGLTQHQVAEMWNQYWPSTNADRPLTHKSISYWEAWPASTGRVPSAEDLCRLARIYRCRAEDLLDGEDYTDPTEAVPQYAALFPYVDAAGPDSILDVGDVGRTMQRRTLLSFSALAVGAAYVDLAAALDRVDLRNLPGEVSTDMLRDVSSISAGYRRSYRSTRAAQLFDAANAHLSLVVSLRPQAQTEQIRRGLLTVVGEMAALSAVLLLLDMNRPHEGWRHLDLAWTAARAADSRELQAIVLAGRSFAVAYHYDDHQGGLELAEAALNLATIGTCPVTRGWIAAVASERCASLNDLGGCQRYLDHARNALGQNDGGGLAGLGIGSFDLDKLTAYEGGDLVRLRRFREAEPILDAAINALPGSMQRHRATAFIDRAEARLGAGDVDAACEDGARALELTSHVQHVGNLRRLRALATQTRLAGTQSGRDLWVDVVGACSDGKAHLAR